MLKMYILSYRDIVGKVIIHHFIKCVVPKYILRNYTTVLKLQIPPVCIGSYIGICSYLLLMGKI